MTIQTFKPKGFYKPNGKFRARAYFDHVLKSSPFTGSTQAVLMALCWAADFNSPTSKITKNQIAAKSGIKQQRTVRQCLGRLKEAGLIRTISGGAGGAGVAPTYEIRPYGAEPPAPEPEAEEQAEMTPAEAVSWEKIREYEARGEPVPGWLARCVRGYEGKTC